MKKLLMVVAVATALVGVTPVYAEESATQSSAVFEKFDGMEQMASLTEQDKALTGAAWAFYYDTGFLGKVIPNAPKKQMWVANCGWAWAAAMVFSMNKHFNGYCQP